MDRNSHFTKTVSLTLHLALLCLVLCLSSGCEEAIVNGPPVAADLEAVADAVENTLGEAAYPLPEEAVEQEPVGIGAADIAKADPAGPGEEFEAETGNVKVETATEADPIVAVQGIFAESAQPVAEDDSAKGAAAELAERIGLDYPIPTTSPGLAYNKSDASIDLDKMHIADILLLSEENAKPATGHEDIEPAEQESAASGMDEADGEEPAEEGEPKGFAAKFILTPCGAVAGFAGKHWFISGAAVVCVVGLMVVKKKKLSFSNSWRRMNSGR